MVTDWIPIPPPPGEDKNSERYKRYEKEMVAFNTRQDMRAQQTFLGALRGIFGKLMRRIK